jgi:hypothetical protein
MEKEINDFISQKYKDYILIGANNKIDLEVILNGEPIVIAENIATIIYDESQITSDEKINKIVKILVEILSKVNEE